MLSPIFLQNVMAEPFNRSLFAPSRGASNDFDSAIREQNLEGRSDCNYRASVGAKEIIASKEKKMAKIRVVVRRVNTDFSCQCMHML